MHNTTIGTCGDNLCSETKETVETCGDKMLIGLTGRKRAGKDTVGDYLIKNHGFDHRFAFADPLKNACAEIFSFSNEQLYGTEEQKETKDEFWGQSPRKILQVVGTELFREKFGEIFPEIGPEIWVKAIQRKIALNPHKNIVVTDVRFENEAKFIESVGGVIWKIHRPSKQLNDDLHASETTLDRINASVVIVNDGSLEDLYKKVDRILDK